LTTAIAGPECIDEKRSNRTEAASCPSTMAVRAYDVAFLHLFEERLPIAIGEASTDVEALLSEVIELEDQRICFTAVDAWPRLEVLE
jgi:hypothetical protein